MILHSDVLRAVAKAIEGDPAVLDICERYGRGYRIVVGHSAEQDMQAEDYRAVISVYAGDESYDLGYVQERVAPVNVRVSTWDKDENKDGIREDCEGALACMDLCHRIAEAVKSIDQLGDDLLAAQVTIDASAWPHTVGTIALSVEWPVALNSEATL